MGIAYAFLAHRFLFEGLHKIFEAVCTFLLVMHPLLSLKGRNHAAYFVFIGVLERVVLYLGHYEFFCNAEVLIATVKLGDMLDQITGLHLDARQVLSPEIRLRHLFHKFKICNFFNSKYQTLL